MIEPCLANFRNVFLFKMCNGTDVDVWLDTEKDDDFCGIFSIFVIGNDEFSPLFLAFFKSLIKSICYNCLFFYWVIRQKYG